MKKFVTAKLWHDTHRLARILAASLGESLVGLFDRLVRQEGVRKNISLPIEEDPDLPIDTPAAPVV